ncbi:IMP cyclohydrolase [Halopelagius longus]|uniref:IMP cyclohydrolase n=1 Tax=Halopelagius longus TaxID=1236180 RepID=A0A1H1EPY7_9EURY|nr:IMP cyclohydrolase [Halopelagius longus]RDI71837.1 IMP cyclohydrolase [Halopelagius longus]SDQ90579.1 IMP cyclohydrolase [Halopelagius longus]
MYVGRFIVVGPDFGAYRVSSRSFPNRRIVDRDGTLTVAPTPDAPESDNPYISYNCVREGGDAVVVGNGSHVDPIAEKLDLGYPARDALAESLLALDYEKDDYDTPRIAGVVTDDDAEEDSYVGVVRRDALLVKAVSEPTLVATYEEDAPTPVEFEASDAESAASGVYEMEYEHAVCAAGVTYRDGEVAVAVENGPDGDGE